MALLGSGEECECEWERLPDGATWSSNDRFVTVTPIKSADQCELTCCYRELGCAAYTFDPVGAGVCKLWIDIEGTSPLTVPGARSGTNKGGTQCKAPAGENPSDPTVPWDYNVAVGWFVLAGLVGSALVYLLLGTLISGGRLPHRAFWGELQGLVKDGVSFVAHGGAAPEGAAVGQGAGSAGGDGQAEGLTASLLTGAPRAGATAPGQAGRGSATPLHIAAQLGDAKGLLRLLEGDTVNLISK